MKQTYNINLGGYPFIIDDDAYALVKNYLDTLSHAFEVSEDDNELLTDIENRMAEHFLMDTGHGKQIITFRMAEIVIARLGKPEEFIEAEILEDSQSGVEEETIKISSTPPPFESHEPKATVRHRLYRDPRGRILGGVCSGIASYLDIDVIWVRLAVVASFFLSASFSFLAYFILWAIVPEARTPLQYMELEGERPTLSNIGKTVTDAFRTTTAAPETPGRSFLQTLMKIVGYMVKGVMILFAIIGVPVLFALGVALVACIIGMICYSIGGMFLPLDIILSESGFTGTPYSLFWMTIAVLLAIGIPILVLLLIMLNSYRQRRILTPGWGIVLAIVWCISMASCWIFSTFNLW